jgi:uncharacterized membrane protein
MRFRKAIISISVINTVLLLYIAWIKYAPQSSVCSSCGNTSFLPVSGVYIALSGAIVCAILAILLILGKNQKIFNILGVITATISAFTASFLQAVQFTISKDFCYYCFVAGILFYVIFLILIYEIVIKPYLDVHRMKTS